MAHALISDQNIIFGVTDTGTLGFFESIDFEDVSDKIEAKDGDGQIIGIDYHSKRYNVSGTYVFDTGQTLPTVGGSITLTSQTSQMAIGANSIYVDTVKQSYSNSDVTKIEFTATTYPSIT
jgi:hypothetical protein